MSMQESNLTDFILDQIFNLKWIKLRLRKTAVKNETFRQWALK
jgi:hypothetical protein